MIEGAAQTEKHIPELFEIPGGGASATRYARVELVCQLADQKDVTDAKAERHDAQIFIASSIALGDELKCETNPKVNCNLERHILL